MSWIRVGVMMIDLFSSYHANMLGAWGSKEARRLS